MSDLLIKLLKEKQKVLAFPIHENWKDAGNFEDFINMNSKNNYLRRDKF